MIIEAWKSSFNVLSIFPHSDIYKHWFITPHVIFKLAIFCPFTQPSVRKKPDFLATHRCNAIIDYLYQIKAKNHDFQKKEKRKLQTGADPFHSIIRETERKIEN